MKTHLLAAAITVCLPLAAHAQSIWPEETRYVYEPGISPDGLGEGVAIHGDRALLGAPAVGRANFSAGYVVAVEYTGETWEFAQKLEAAEGQLDDRFGFSVALNATHALVGAPEAAFLGDNTGAAYVFTLDAGVWTQRLQLLPEDENGGLAFGASVAVYGNTLLVGAPDINIGQLQTGEAYIYEIDDGTIVHTQRLQYGDFSFVGRFGESVALGEHLAVIGTPNRGLGGQNFGSVVLYERGETEWEFLQELQADDQQAQDVFGSSVAVDGDWMLVGAPREDDGASNSGAVYVFRREGGEWTEVQRLKAPTPLADDLFGESVSISGGVAVVGTSHNDERGLGAGTVYVFTYNGAEWAFTEQLFASDGEAGDDLAKSVAIDGDVIVAGAAGADGDDAEESVGTAYFFRKDPLATAIEEESLPSAAGLSMALYPNPAGGDVTLHLMLPAPQSVTIDVYDLLGRRVEAGDHAFAAGEARLPINAEAWPNGVYFVRVEGAGGAVESRRLVVRR